MRKIYISYWSKGNLSSKHDESLNLKLLENFVNCVKKYTSDIEIHLVTDSYTIGVLTDDIIEKITIHNTLDVYNDYEPWEWAIIKLLVISSITDEFIYHFDFDIVIKYDLNKMLEYFENSKYDVLYQKYEPLTISEYRKFFKKRPEYKNIYDNISNKVAYNAGITFIRNKNSEIPNIIKKYVTEFKKTDEWLELLSLEQILIPCELINNGYNVNCLVNLSVKMDKIMDTNKFIGDDKFTSQMYIDTCKTGVFMENIGFYHFIGNMKSNYDVMKIIKEIIEL